MDMGTSIFQIVNPAVAVILAILLVRFAWTVWFSSAWLPAEWRDAARKGRLSPRLRRLSRTYPDKVRFYSWWMQVDRLRRDRIPGAFAEVGVYKGESAKVLHEMDPDRLFHLFDTFEGFDADDLSRETGEAASYTTRHFADTAIKDVLKRVGGNSNISLHPGYFPETAAVVAEEEFALVNLDADLYLPTLAALEFFYERLSPGGVIFVHDCNHKWEGIRKAVGEFSIATGEIPVLLPDADSTAVFIKRIK